MNRRTWLRALGGASTIAALSGGVGILLDAVADKRLHAEIGKLVSAEDHASAAVFGREWMENNFLETQAFLRSADGARILREGNDDEVGAMILSLSGVLQEEVVKSPLDPARRFTSFPALNASIVISSLRDLFSGTRSLRFNMLGTRRRALSYGNAFRIGEGLIMTNDHVARNTPSVIFTGIRENLDVAVIKTTSNIAGAPILRLSEKGRAEMLGGRITITGIDPDKAALADGSKRYMSLIVPATPHIMRFIRRHFGRKYVISDSEWKDMENSHICIFHPGNMIHMNRNVHYDNVTGMSGSPALFDNGEVGGIFHSRLLLNINGTLVGIGFLHVAPQILSRLPEEIRKQLSIA